MPKTQSKPLDGARGKRADPTWQAQDILSRRDHSEAEVRGKLRRKGFTPDQIDMAIRWLQEKRLLNDAAFARRYIAAVLSAKAVGRRWLKHKLQEKGIAASIQEEALNAALAPEQETALAERAAAAWQRAHSQHASDRQRLVRHLLSRGFSWETISRALSALQ